MPKNELRFAVVDDVLKLRAGTWKLVAEQSKHGIEVYLHPRELKGALHTSFHPSGAWHTKWSKKALALLLEGKPGHRGGQVADKWRAPIDISPGVTLACSIITPCGSVATPLDVGHLKGAIRIPAPPLGHATRSRILIAQPGAHAALLDGEAEVGQLALPGGTSVLVTAAVVQMPDLTALAKTVVPSYFGSRGRGDVAGENLRLHLTEILPDGSRTYYDMKVQIAARSTSPPS